MDTPWKLRDSRRHDHLFRRPIRREVAWMWKESGQEPKATDANLLNSTLWSGEAGVLLKVLRASIPVSVLNSSETSNASHQVGQRTGWTRLTPPVVVSVASVIEADVAPH